MNTLNLFLDIEFTSLSPDAQVISLGIMSDNIKIFPEKSFYAEFSDFDLNRCDDWVKENVVGKLHLNEKFEGWDTDIPLFKHFKGYPHFNIKAETNAIQRYLKDWLSQFSDYQIQFIVDCGTWDWYHFVQLIGKWKEKDNPDEDSAFSDYCLECGSKGKPFIKTGLPKLPSNISPIPFDLNDLIAIKKGITPKEAFDLNREEMAEAWKESIIEFKHNSLWDAKVIKAIYNKLK